MPHVRRIYLPIEEIASEVYQDAQPLTVMYIHDSGDNLHPP